MLSNRSGLTAGAAVAALVVGLLGTSARGAVVLNPGQSGVTVPLDDSSITGSAVATGSVNSSSTPFTGVTVSESVFKTGAATDFVFQVVNNSGYTITSLTVSAYGSYTTAVGYEDTSGSKLALPYTAARDGSGASGNDITFTFGGGLSTGVSSVPVFILTNASGYDASGASNAVLISGNFSTGPLTLGNGSIYEPTGAVVPEPSSIALLGCLATVGGIGTWVRRRRLNVA